MTESGNERESEMEPRQGGMDSLLRRSMAAPMPSLKADFDQRVMRAVRRSGQPLDRYRRILLIGYGVTSAVACAVVMRGQGLGWGATAGIIVAPLALIALGRSAWRATHATMRRGAH